MLVALGRTLVAVVAAGLMTVAVLPANAWADPSDWMGPYLCTLSVPKLVELEATYRADPARWEEADLVHAELTGRDC